MRRNSYLVIVSGLIIMMLLASCSNAEEEVPAGMESQQYGCLGTAEDALVDLECREVTIAVENAYLPFNYISAETGAVGGWDYEVWEEICTLLHCQPVFVETAWAGMIQLIADGGLDVGADGITIKDIREEQGDFSIGYMNVEQRLLARLDEDRFSSIEEFVQNEDLIMGTQAETTNYETAAEYLPEDRISAFEQFPFAIQALMSGDVDAVIIDESAGLGYRGTNADEIGFVGPSIVSDQLGFFFETGSDLVEPVNAAIQVMMDSGFLDEVNLRYFGPDFTITYDDIE